MHAHLLSLPSTHTHTLPPLFPPADVLLYGFVTPFIPRSWRAHVSHFSAAVTWSMKRLQAKTNQQVWHAAEVAVVTLFANYVPR